MLLVACLLVAGSVEAQVVEVPLETCWTSSSDFVPQPFNNELPALVLQWDSFSTSKIATAAAGMILKEKMGFRVRLEAGRTSGEAYQALSEGNVHLVMEAWTESNKDMFQEYVAGGKNVDAYPHSTLFGRSGIYETCNRMGSDPNYPTCVAGKGTEPLLRYCTKCYLLLWTLDQMLLWSIWCSILRFASTTPHTSFDIASDTSRLTRACVMDAVAGREVLATPEGQAYFSADKQIGQVWSVAPENIWTPAHCKAEGVTCDALILHIASEGYDEGQVEEKVELLELRARVAYLGQENHSKAIWNAYVKHKGVLVYGFFPNSNHYGISILDLPRAKIVPGLDFRQQNLMVVSPPTPPSCSAHREGAGSLRELGAGEEERKVQEL